MLFGTVSFSALSGETLRRSDISIYSDSGVNGQFEDSELLRYGSSLGTSWVAPFAVAYDSVLPRTVHITVNLAGAQSLVTVDLAPLHGPDAQCSIADLASLGGDETPDGQLTVDDIVVFLQAFFGNEMSVADLASLGGASVPDGLLTADDLIAFLSAFFAGCP